MTCVDRPDPLPGRGVASQPRTGSSPPRSHDGALKVSKANQKLLRGNTFVIAAGRGYAAVPGPAGPIPVLARLWGQ
jgi:hypothetical protein